MKKGLILAAIMFVVASSAGLSVGTRSHFAVDKAFAAENERVVLPGNIHPKARSEFDAGPTDPSLPMKRMILLLKIAPDKQAALDKLLAEQQDRSSPNYHKWLKPEEFGERFGRSPEEIASVKSWLTQHGLTVDETAKGGNWINFSGTVAQVESAFRMKMHDYNVEGRVHHANSNDPSIPSALSDVVAGPVTLHNFSPKPALSRSGPMPDGKRQPSYTYSYEGSTYQALAPGDFAVIYDVNAVYNQSYDGTGVTIAVVEQTHPSASPGSWNTFRSTFGLPYNPPNIVVNGPDPGDTGAYDDSEADLDAEWASAVAPGATIDFVVSGSGLTSGGLSAFGVDLSAQYIVNNNLAQIVSDTYGDCESDMGTAWMAFYNTLWAQAASQGMTVFVATGDTGAYACTNNNGYPVAPKAVNGYASTPYNIAVGGTRFNVNASNVNKYWSSSNTANEVSALSYMPEIAWNDLWAYSASSGYPVQYYEAASGGGASSYFPKPSWQVSPGVPSNNARYIPDVSLNADDINFPYLVYTCTNFSGPCTMPAANEDLSNWPMFGGTSTGTPSFAGIMALLVQMAGGERQGNFNTSLYKFGQAQYGKKSGALQVFHDITSGTNGFVGSGANLPGYSCTVGYDQVTGLGSVDALNLLLAFQEGLAATHFSVSAPSSATSGTAFNFTVTALDTNNQTVTGYSGTVHFTSTDGSAALPANTTLTSGTGTFSATLNTAGSQTITATDTATSSITGTSNKITVSAQTGSRYMLWSATGGQVSIWTLDNSNNYLGSTVYGPLSGWSPITFTRRAVDGTGRLLWSSTGGAASIWTLDSSNNYLSSKVYGPYSGWTPLTYASDPTDGTARLIWAGTGGSVSIWRLDASDNYISSQVYGPYNGWTPVTYACNPLDGTARLIWAGTGGAASVWKLDASDNYVSSQVFGPFSGWSPVAFTFNSANGTSILTWASTAGQASVWKFDSAQNYQGNYVYGPYSGWSPVTCAFNSVDGTPRLIWSGTGGMASIWSLDSSGNYLGSTVFGPFNGWMPIAYW